jgi:ABC-type multidrug transport system fused ATPase/permease subunit
LSAVLTELCTLICDADQILVLTHGEILERGTHQQLLTQQGFYYRLSSGGTAHAA